MHAARNGLGDPPVVVRQLVRPEPKGAESGRVGTVGDTIHESGLERHVFEGESIALLPEVRWLERRAAQGAQDLADRVLRQLGQVAHRGTVVQVESADSVAGDKVRG